MSPLVRYILCSVFAVSASHVVIIYL